MAVPPLIMTSVKGMTEFSFTHLKVHILFYIHILPKTIIMIYKNSVYVGKK